MQADKKNNTLSLCFYALLVMNAAVLIVVSRTNSSTVSNWIAFLWWSINVTCAVFLTAVNMPLHFYRRIKRMLRTDASLLFFLIVLTLLTRFFLIDRYPYISLGDELRDAGLNALKIKQGIITDFFDFGSYQGYGNFIPLISYFFTPLFNLSPLIYRIPSALFGTGAVMLTYLLGRAAGGRKTGVAAVLFLTGSLLHLHYSRTELLVIMDSFLSPLIIAAVLSTFYLTEGFLLIGLIAGISMHFYAGIRGIIAASLLYLAAYHVIQLIAGFTKKEKGTTVVNLKTIALGIILFSIGFAIGAGPTINKLKSANIYTNVGTTTLIFNTSAFRAKPTGEKIMHLWDLYTQAFLTYTFKPTNDFHFVYYQKRQKESLLPAPLNWLFLAGLGYILITRILKKKFFQLLLTIIIVFPFINQVLVNTIGFDHRLMSIMPVLMVVAAVGVNALALLLSLIHI